MANPLVTVIGAGNVGATTAQRIVEQGLADVWLVDIVEGLPQGKALDLAEAAPVTGHDMAIRGTNDYADTAGSDVIVITAGLARQPGMSRDDLMAKNAGIVQGRGADGGHSPEAIIIVVTNPLDAMSHVAMKVSGLPTTAWSAWPAFSTPPASAPSSPRSWTCRSPTPRPSCWVATATPWCRWRATRPSAACRSPSSSPRRSTIVAAHARRRRRDREPAQDRQRLLRPGAAVVQMVEAILKDKKRVLPCAAWLEGEYGVDGVYIGVPTRLGRRASRASSRSATDDEQAAFATSAEAVQGLVDTLVEMASCAASEQDIDVGMVGINVPHPGVRVLLLVRWLASLALRRPAHVRTRGRQSYTKGRVVTSRWPDPSTSKVDPGFPRTR